MRVVDPAPGWWEWGPNTDLGKGPQSRSRFPTAEPRDTAEAPSWNAAPKESRGLRDNQGGTGCGGTGPTPQTPRAGAELPGRKGLVGGSAAFPAGSGRREPFCVGRAEAATTTTPGPRPHSRAHIRARVRAHATAPAQQQPGMPGPPDPGPQLRPRRQLGHYLLLSPRSWSGSGGSAGKRARPQCQRGRGDTKPLVTALLTFSSVVLGCSGRAPIPALGNPSREPFPILAPQHFPGPARAARGVPQAWDSLAGPR